MKETHNLDLCFMEIMVMVQEEIRGVSEMTEAGNQSCSVSAR